MQQRRAAIVAYEAKSRQIILEKKKRFRRFLPLLLLYVPVFLQTGLRPFPEAAGFRSRPFFLIQSSI